MSNQNHKYNIINSFKYAFTGISKAFQKERNLTVQTLIGIASITYFWYFKEVNFIIASLVMTSLVISLELVNTSFEYLSDLIEPNHNEKIKFIKDVSAGAVLFAALGWITIISYGFLLTFPFDKLF